MNSLRTITVAQLIEVLQNEDPDAQVIVSADYGDYHHTEQALPLHGDVEEVLVHKSAYSNSGWAVTTEEPDEDETDEAPKFLRLS